MIRRFSLPRLSRTDTTADLVDGLLATFTAVPADEDTGRDRSLEILVKNANPTDTLDDSHARRIWRDLRKRMTGPFGRLAIEGPVRSTFECGDAKGATAPFALSDRSRTSRRISSQIREPARDLIDASLLKVADGPRIVR